MDRKGQAAALLFMLAAFSPCVFSLNPSLDVSQYAHKAWTIREGFFKGIILSIAQTQDGYMWLGTESGLLRFDGVQALEWAPPGQERLPGARIFSLLAARDGSLWIGTDAGLVSWNGTKLTRYPDLAGQAVWSMLEDREGTTWVGAYHVPSGGRLCEIRRGTMQCHGQDGSLNGVLALYEDGAGNLWAGTTSQLWRWKPGSPRSYAAPGRNVRGMVQDNGGNLLISTEAGMYRFVEDRLLPYSISGGAAPSATRTIRDRDGGLWIGTLAHGLIHVGGDRTDMFSLLDGLSANLVTGLFEDHEGNIWAVTDGGLDRFRELPVASVSVKQGLSTDNVFAVLAAKDGSVWLTGRNGVDRWKNEHVTTYRKVNGLPDDNTLSLFEDDLARIWVSSQHGIARFDEGRFIAVRGVTDGDFVGGDAALWLSQAKSLLHLADGRLAETLPWSQLGRSQRAYAIARDPKNGGLWLGFETGGGVDYFRDGQIRKSYTRAEGLGEGWVTHLQLDPDGTWASTQGGLSVITQQRIATLTSKNGLPCDTVHWTIDDDDHSKWLYMACGLVRIARADLDAWMADPKRRIAPTIFDSSEGVRVHPTPISSYTPSVAKSTDGKLWFTAGDGVSVIDPAHLPVNKLPPPVHIEKVIADEKEYNLAPSLRLPALTRDLRIEYTALSFVAPEKVRFKVKLEGQDRDWMDEGTQRQTHYSNLKPRKYRFRVIASNNSGVWNETGDMLEFSIAPAFYQTNWFIALLAAAAIFMMATAYRVRMWQVQRETRRLRDVIETIPAYVWSAQPDGSIDFVNRRWLEFSGFSMDRALGWGWADAVHPEDRPSLLDAWRGAIKSGEAMEAEARMRGADGQYRWMSFRAVPQRDETGKLMKWYGKSMDIEDSKRAEQERERVRQLETDLAHINRVSMMGELSASIAHEVNQPLAGIVSNGGAALRFLNREVPDLEEVRDAVTDMVRDGKRAGEVIKRIRALTRRTDAAPREKLDLNETVREVLAIVGDEAKRNQVTIRTQFADELGPVSGDRVQLQQVLLNLTMNSIQAMSAVSDRARELTITTRWVEADRVEAGQVQVTVQDSGTGIDPEKMARIFDPFFTTKSTGMGMGLAICRSIIENDGGKIWVTENEGPGVSFHFTLPEYHERHAGSSPA